jgi:hypothetical protein
MTNRLVAAITISAACCAFPVMAASANWQVYQRGSAMELALDRGAIWSESDGLVHFVNQERFAKPLFEKNYKVWFSIRRTTGYADCARQQYVLVSTDFYSDSNRHVWSTMYPVPRYAWKWQPVVEDSVAASMINLVCANPAPRKKPE